MALVRIIHIPLSENTASLSHVMYALSHVYPAFIQAIVFSLSLLSVPYQYDCYSYVMYVFSHRSISSPSTHPYFRPSSSSLCHPHPLPRTNLPARPPTNLLLINSNACVHRYQTLTVTRARLLPHLHLHLHNALVKRTH